MISIDIKSIEAKLKGYKVLCLEIQNLKIDLEDYKYRLNSGDISLGSKSNNPLPGRVTARAPVSPIEQVLIGQITDLDKKYFRLKECTKLKDKIDNTMNSLSDRDRKLIEGFYIQGRTLYELSLDLNMNPDYLSAVKRNILETYFYTI